MLLIFLLCLMDLVFQNIPKMPQMLRSRMCAQMSSLSIGRHQNSQHSVIAQMKEPLPSQMTGESATSAREIGISTVKSDMRLDTQTQIMPDAREMEDDLLFFDEQRQRDPEVITEKASSLSHPLTFHSLAQARGYPQLTDVVGPTVANTQIVDLRADPLLQLSSIIPLPKSYSKSVFNCVADLGGIDENYYPMSNEGKRMHLETSQVESASMDRSTSVATGENNIISNILSMNIDPWGESLSSTQNLAKWLGETEQVSLEVSSSRKLQNSNQSRFSFGRGEEPVHPSTDFQSSHSYIEQSVNYHSRGHDLLNSRSYQRNSFDTRNGFSQVNKEDSNGFANCYSHLSSDRQSVSRSQMLAPPGFSAPKREPPPGFTFHERMEHHIDSLSGHMLETSFYNNQFQTPSVGNVSNGGIEFVDPSILAVGKARAQTGLDISNLDMSQSSPPQLSTFEN